MVENQQQKKPIVWTIAASDSCGCTGIQADLHTFHDFAVHGCTVITAVTAQNSFAQGYSVATERKNVVAQINALDSDMPANAIKIGVLPNREIVETVVKYLDDFDGFVVYDPELDSSGEQLLADAGDLLHQQLLPRVNLLVINIDEAKVLADKGIENFADIQAAANSLLASGVSSVLITGGRFASAEGKRYDYWATASDALWITVDELQTVNNRGGGSTLTAAIAASIGLGKDVKEAIRLAKAYVTQGIRGSHSLGSGPGSVAHLGWPKDPLDFPVVSADMPQ